MVAQLGQFAATVLNHFAAPATTDDGHEFKVLDHKTKSNEAHEFEHELSARVVGQERALRALAQIYQVYQAGLNTPGRPIGTLLFLARPEPERPAQLKPLRRCSSATRTHLFE